jgi:hypothetical protein
MDDCFGVFFMLLHATCAIPVFKIGVHNKAKRQTDSSEFAAVPSQLNISRQTSPHLNSNAFYEFFL